MNKITKLSRLRKKKIIKDPLAFKINNDLTRKFREWYANGGRDALDESMERADKAIEKMRKARRLDLTRIHEPMTI